jgi:ATP-dependent DNA helicase RecQ
MKGAAAEPPSAMLRTGESFGAEHLIAILRGERSEKVLGRGHHRLPTFGVGAARGKAEWQAIFRQLLGLDLIRPDPTRHGALRLTEPARPLLRGETTITLRADTVRRPGGRAAPRAEPVALVDADDEGLFAALKARRRELADAAGVPAYVIFSDRTLIELATHRPQTLDAMGGITGVGSVKLARFGATFLEIIIGEAPPQLHPSRRKLAGTPGGALFDRLHAAQLALAYGSNGRDRYLGCTAATLAKIAAARPRTLDALEGIHGMGPMKAERFGAAFLEILSDDG